MRAEPDWFEYYSILGVTSDCDWSAIRKAYRQLAQSTHPDRFSENTDERKVAETQIVDINRAYTALQEYYRKHDRLPGQRFQKSSAHKAGFAEPTSASTVSNDGTSGFTRSSATPRRRSRSVFRSGVRLAAIVGVSYYVYLAMMNSGDITPATPSPPPISMNVPADENGTNLTLDTTPTNFFTPGSTMGEVHAAQGNPTRTDGTTWYYGESRVTFVGGVVKSWKNTVANPLRIRPLDPDLGTRTTHSRLTSRFTIGSTKADVLAIQGKPIRMSDTVWDYGVSQVKFEKDRVVNWTDSPLQPLKTEKPLR